MISVRTELVAVPVTVTDASGRPVSGLAEENFRIFEDGRPQPIAVFHRGEVPVTLGVIVDRSQSMRAKGAALVSALSAVLPLGRPDDELFAVVFNDRVSLALPDGTLFTRDTAVLEGALAASRAEGRTALYDGVAEGLHHLQLGRAQKRALIVISDGGDNASALTYARVLDLARRSDAAIYAIGLLGASLVEDEEDAGLLTRLCRDSGGMAFFPRTAGEVAAMSAQIARDIREQYTLGFTPGARTDEGAFHKIAVTVTSPDHRRLLVRTRAGYLSGGSPDAKDGKGGR